MIQFHNLFIAMSEWWKGFWDYTNLGPNQGDEAVEGYTVIHLENHVYHKLTPKNAESACSFSISRYFWVFRLRDHPWAAFHSICQTSGTTKKKCKNTGICCFHKTWAGLNKRRKLSGNGWLGWYCIVRSPGVWGQEIASFFRQMALHGWESLCARNGEGFKFLRIRSWRLHSPWVFPRKRWVVWVFHGNLTTFITIVASGTVTTLLVRAQWTRTSRSFKYWQLQMQWVNVVRFSCTLNRSEAFLLP